MRKQTGCAHLRQCTSASERHSDRTGLEDSASARPDVFLGKLMAQGFHILRLAAERLAV